jgi:Zn-dependent protease
MHEVANLAVWYLVFVFSTTCHEAAHAWVAYRGGDPTAYSLGHVTLDPTPHIRRSPFGMVVIPILSFLFPLLVGQGGHGWMIGWASVPVNRQWAVKHPRRAAVMSLAGPAANLLLAALSLGVMRLLLDNDVLVMAPPSEIIKLESLVAVPDGHNVNTLLGALAKGLSVMLFLNLILGLFNLVPLPPLDGASALEGAAPRATAGFFQLLREVPAVEFLGLLVAWRFFPYVWWPAFFNTVTLLHV